jgi:putative lipoprotein
MVRSTLVIKLSFFTCLMVGGCIYKEQMQQEAAEEEVQETTPQRFLGHLVFGHEVRSFRPCGSTETLWVTDRSGLLWDIHQELAPHTGPYEEVFFVLAGQRGPPLTEGFGADYSGELVVEEVIYGAWEGFSCDSSWTGFSYRAAGNEPFWTAEVSDRGLVVKRPGEVDLRWIELKEQLEGDAITLEGHSPAHGSVLLEIVPAPCRDSMSGAYFGNSAKLLLGEETMKGCALNSR